jgi:hypothetical protein
MPGALRRTTFLISGMSALIAFAWPDASFRSALSQQPKTDAGAKPTPLYAGVSACRKCHTSSDQIKDAPPELCRCTEIPVWEKEDKHHLAYAVLESERAKEMGRILGWNVKEDNRCLSCHGVVIKDPELRKRSEEVGFSLKEGVTCTICHGPYLEWVGMHGDPLRRPTWRKLSRMEKEATHGMTDLWDPQKRAQLCASCHIGNAEQGKFVTHAMYAAGHPPLPSFELASFSEEMPRHWQYLREKKPEVQALLRFKPEEARWEQTKLVAVGSVAALRSSFDLLASQAERSAQEKDPQKQILDFALFDCAGCHHELKKDGWRTIRGYAGKPGRPMMLAWPTDLARLGLLDGKDTELNGVLRKLADAFVVRPFGEPGRIATEAKALVKWLDPVIARQASRNYDEAIAKRWLTLVTQLKETDYPEYDTARQRAWAFAIISDELEWKPEAAGTDPRKAFEQRLKLLDEQLNGMLMLALPSGQNKDILKELPGALKRQGNYDPRTFVDKFRALGPKP